MLKRISVPGLAFLLVLSLAACGFEGDFYATTGIQEQPEVIPQAKPDEDSDSDSDFKDDDSSDKPDAAKYPAAPVKKPCPLPVKK